MPMYYWTTEFQLDRNFLMQIYLYNVIDYSNINL